MSGRWYNKTVGVVTLGALGALHCATPIREDPPSTLGQGSGTGGESSGTSDDDGSTTNSSNASAGFGTLSGTNTSSSSTTGSGGGGSDSTTSATTTTSASDGGSGGGGSTTTTDGSGGDGGTTTDDAANTVGASTTGAGTITDDLPWSDDFEMYTENGVADRWNPLESGGGWTVVPGNEGLGYATLAEAGNRNLTWAGNPAWNNMRLQVDVRLSGGGDSTRIYFAVRAAERAGDSNKLDYYFGYLRGDGDVRIGKYIDGSTSDENDATSSGVDATSWNTVAVTVDGDSLTMEVNGSVESTHTLTGRDSGFIALGVDSGLAEFDNVTVTAP